jgi:DNA modification methylase
MAINDQQIKDQYAIYHGDCLELMPTLPEGKVHLSVYSPPFCGLYHYSSSERDLSNCRDYGEFFKHYELVVRALHRLTMPGRMTAVHCADVPAKAAGNVASGSECDPIVDFSGDIIRLHQRLGWHYIARYHVWKEPLGVRIRTMLKGLAHQTLVEDAARFTSAAADYLLIFRKQGKNPVPIEHPRGFESYAGARDVPSDLHDYCGWPHHQTGNKYSQWIWRQYASAFWDDIRLDRVLPFQDSRDDEDERHVHPLQLDVIDRAVQLWSNPGETVFTPFMGVGSEPWSAIGNRRRGVGVELKASYYRQAVKNMAEAAPYKLESETKQASLFATDGGFDYEQTSAGCGKVRCTR